MSLETAIELAACEAAESAGWLCRKFRYIGRRNGPDRIFIRDGRVVFIEFKKPGKAPRPGQRKEHKRLMEHGAEVHIIDNLEDALALLC